MALAHDLQIDSDDQRGAFRILGAGEKPLHELVVLQRVDLEPEGRVGVAGHIFDRADRHGGQGERYAEFLGGTCGLDLAIGRLHAAKPHGGKRHGHGHILAHHLGRGRAARHVDGNALAQADLVEIRAIVVEGLLCPAARFGIIVEHLGDAALVEPLEVFDFSDDGHAVGSLPRG